MAIIGIMRQSSQESEDYARVNNRVSDLEESLENAITVNGEFDSTAGFWGQVKFDGFTDDAVIVHKKISTENYNNLEVTPNIITQSLVSYSADSGQNFTRITDSYHELVVNGEANVTSDTSSPNFTPMGISAFNKTKGNVGVGGLTVRVDDVHYPDSVLGELGASKSCGIGTIVSRRADYSQGRHDASYSIGIESVVVNLAEEDGIEGTDGYFVNKQNVEYWAFDTWTNCIHCVGGGRRPITAGLLFNGKSSWGISVDSNGKPVKDAQNNAIIENGIERTHDHFEYVSNGMYNAIYIGASAMRIRYSPVRDTNGNLIYDDVLQKDGTTAKVLRTTTGNSPLTSGISTSNWSKNGNHGFAFLRAGYAPRILKSRGSALFESPGAKFLNANGGMPFAISANGVPYLDFKTGSDSDYYDDPTTKLIPKERPTDTTRARIGYNTTTNYLNTISDGDIRFVVNGTFTATTNQNAEADEDGTAIVETEDNSIVYKFQGNSFISSVAASTEENHLYANLGSASYKWGNIYANNGTINTSDKNLKEDIKDIDEKILRAWSKVSYKVFRFKNGNRKHIGVIAQDIQTAFESEGLDAHDYGLFCEDVDEQGNKILGVRYSECLALECAYLRSRIGA